MKKLIVVSDWVDDSLTCAEFSSAVLGFLNESKTAQITFVSSTSSTIHTSFLINQIVEVEERFGRPLETVIFQNTDPRLQSKTKVEKAQGAKFLVIRLKSGLYLCGPNAGYDFSMVKERIDEVFEYKDFDKGSQFRSRDLYSRVCAHLMEAMEDELDLEEVLVDVIPDLKGFYIGHIDNFGNIKTTITHEDLKGKVEYGEYIKIKIGKVVKKVRYVDNLFGGEVGELVIYPGSSGKKDNPYLEISVWRHFDEEKSTTGKDEFLNPKVGEKIELLFE
jgi:S-adenosylmethionine hydrolase